MTPGTFLDPTALAIVGGGTLLATILRTPLRDLARAIRALAILPRRRFRADPLLEQIAHLSRVAKRHGVVALDDTVVGDTDVARAIAQIVDADAPDAIATAIEEARRQRAERHRIAADVWHGIAETAPAMGMVGTLIGLVAMFTRVNDAAAIGASMAVALLATLYGALLANLVALPIATRLRNAARVEAMERLRLIPPQLALAVREAPRAIALVQAVPSRSIHDVDDDDDRQTDDGRTDPGVAA